MDKRIEKFGTFNLPNLISVGALKSDGTRPSVSDWGYDSNGNPQGSSYSSNGTNVNIYAPGDTILTTIQYGYGNSTGTSMAAPFVTGVAALMLSVNPDLTGAQLKEVILNNADDIDITIPGDTQRVKKLNAFKAVKAVKDGKNRLI